MLHERRNDPRLTLQQCVKISLYGLETFIDAEALNISENGILCASPVSVENLEKIFIMVDLDVGGETKNVQSDGIVLYTQKKGDKHLFGIQFIDMTPATKEILKQYVDKYGDQEAITE